MPEINEIVNDPPKIKQFLTEGDCAILQDEYSIKDLCTKMDEIKSTECDVDQLKSLVISEDAPGMEALSGVQTENTESTCDPEIASALGNLDEEKLKESIKNTYNKAVNDPVKQCELPKI